MFEKVPRTTCCQATPPDSLAVTGVSQSRLTPLLGFLNRPEDKNPSAESAINIEGAAVVAAPCASIANWQESLLLVQVTQFRRRRHHPLAPLLILGLANAADFLNSLLLGRLLFGFCHR